MSREEDIMYMLESDWIWSPLFHPNLDRFVKALEEVLYRLPDDYFDRVYDGVHFVVDVGIMRAVNVPGVADRSDHDHVVIFFMAFSLSDKGLIGLIAHELAHSFVVEYDYAENEKAADDLVRRWGFADELAELRRGSSGE